MDIDTGTLEAKLGLKYPIFWNLAAIEPAFAIRLVYKITTTRPKVIIEVGAGNSTVITLKTLKSLGIPHKVYSIDADEWFLNETKNLLIAEGLYDPKHVEFIYAPLKKVKIEGKERLWHDLKGYKWDFDQIDLLTIDGPMGSLSKESRYPAVPFFKKYLKPGSSIILDDFDRKDERSIAKKWLDENKYLEFVYRGPSERGQGEFIMHDKKRSKIYKDLPPLPSQDMHEVEIAQLQAELDALRSSRAWRLARKVADTYHGMRG